MESPEIFEEIKKSCKSNHSDLTSVVDDVHGTQNISKHFKNIYETLYNEQGDFSEELIDCVTKNIEENIDSSKDVISLITS